MVLTWRKQRLLTADGAASVVEESMVAGLAATFTEHLSRWRSRATLARSLNIRMRTSMAEGIENMSPRVS
jgi:hypothetical protein